MGITGSLVLEVLVFSLITIILYNLLKVFVISKIKITMQIKIGSIIVSVALLIISTLLSNKFKVNSWQYYTGMAILFLAIFTTVDFWTGNKNRKTKIEEKRNDSLKPRPKAKPNRVKNRNK